MRDNRIQYCPTNPTNRQQMAAFLVKTFGAPLLYCPTNSVTRGQMSAFLTKTFLLALYGP